MKERLPIEEQAAKLTEEEKERILKDGKLGKLCSMLFILAAFLIVIGFCISLMAPALGGSGESITPLSGIVLIAGAALAVFCIVGMIVTKKKCPIYTEQLYTYLFKKSLEK